MNYKIEMNQVNVVYGNNRALSNVTLELEEGKIYGLVGRNGAGKSTLLSLLSSFREPTTGTITIGGRNPFENSDVMSQVTFVYDTDYSEETEKVSGMLEFSERYRPNFDRAYAEKLAKLFQLPMNKQMKQLSKGQKSAVNVVIGLANRSPITIFDEAYVGMDAPTRELFYKEVLEDHARFPRTIILSTHLVSEMDYLFEEVIFLHKGQILMKAPIDEVLEQGVVVTGPAQEVDAFVAGMNVLNTQQLGGTKSASIFGELSADQRRAARQQGLELGSVSLQDLFIHLTKEGNEDD